MLDVSSRNMTEDTFWKLIEGAGSPSECSPEKQCENISQALSGLSERDLIEFENIRHRLLVRLYTWPMLKACFVLLKLRFG